MNKRENMTFWKTMGVTAALAVATGWGVLSCKAKQYLPSTPRTPTEETEQHYQKQLPKEPTGEYREAVVEAAEPAIKPKPTLERKVAGPEGIGPKPKENPLEAYAEYIAPFEGFEPKVYDPNQNDDIDEPTVGVGFYMLDDNARETFNEALPELDFDEVLAGNQTLSVKQGNRLFATTLPNYVEKAQRLLPEFDSYSENVRAALVNAFYRGDIGPKTRKLINEGKWDEATKEYLNHGGYKTAEEKGEPGVRIRMGENAGRMKQYADRLKAGE